MPTGAPFQSNTSFQMAGTLTSVGTSVNITTAIEDGRIIDAEDASVVLATADGKTLERMICDIENGVMTIVQRGLNYSDTPTTDATLQREWRTGTRGYITALSFNLFNATNNTGQTQTIVGNVAFTGDITMSGDSTIKDLDIDNTGYFRAPKYANSTARDAAVPSPDGANIGLVGAGLQYYNSTTVQWETIGTSTPVPNAEETVAGISELATLAEQGAGTSTGGTGAELVLQSKNTAKTPDATPANDENKVPVLNASGRVDDFVRVPHTQQEFTAGEALSAGELVYVKPSDGKVYLVDSLDSTTTNFIGFADAAAVLDATVAINTGITDDNQSGLTIGDKYYIDKSVDGFDLSGGSYTGNVLLNAQDTGPLGLTIGDSGTKLYMIGNTNNGVYQYTLPTAYDLTSAVYSGKSLTTTAEDSTPRDASFSEDGATMFLMGGGSDTVYQYTLGTAWDISTASYASKSFSVTSEDANPKGISVGNGGSTMFILGGSSDTVYQYTMGTPGDITTASYDSKSMSFTPENTTPEGIFLNSDGTALMMVGTSPSDTVYRYTLSTPFDVSTGSYASDSLLVNAQDTSPQDITFDPNGQTMFMIGASTDDMFQYDIGFAFASIPGAITDTPVYTSGADEENILVGQATTATTIQFETLNTNNLGGVQSITATAGAITPGNIEGYITVNVNGTDKKIAYYGV